MSWENHDGCAKSMLSTLAVIETEQFADRITVVRRDGTLLNRLPRSRTLHPDGRTRVGAAATARAGHLPPKADAAQSVSSAGVGSRWRRRPPHFECRR